MAEMIGIHIVHLEVREGNGRPEDCMNVLALKKMVCVKTYYTDPTENAVLMTKMQEKIYVGFMFAWEEGIRLSGDDGRLRC